MLNGAYKIKHKNIDIFLDAFVEEDFLLYIYY